ncbi:MAG: hypothetical protein JW731_03060 [Bacteroidales bacterium]|nr:hypothetical protein [Bacteroidales bacterium]
MKSLLNMCALNAKKHDKEIALYYERKVKDGKNPMSVMNAIRCKVLSRVFAVINRGSPFINTYKFAVYFFVNLFGFYHRMGQQEQIVTPASEVSGLH